MEIWLLRPTANDHFWRPWYDKAFGFVICAETEKAARGLAQENGGDETCDGNPAWTDAHYSTCEPLSKHNHKTGVILQDFAAA